MDNRDQGEFGFVDFLKCINLCDFYLTGYISEDEIVHGTVIDVFSFMGEIYFIIQDDSLEEKVIIFQEDEWILKFFPGIIVNFSLSRKESSAEDLGLYTFHLLQKD